MTNDSTTNHSGWAFDETFAGEPPLRLDIAGIARLGARRVRRRGVTAISGLAAGVALVTVGAATILPKVGNGVAAAGAIPGCATVTRTPAPPTDTTQYSGESLGSSASGITPAGTSQYSGEPQGSSASGSPVAGSATPGSAAASSSSQAAESSESGESKFSLSSQVAAASAPANGAVATESSSGSSKVSGSAGAKVKVTPGTSELTASASMSIGVAVASPAAPSGPAGLISWYSPTKGAQLTKAWQGALPAGVSSDLVFPDQLEVGATQFDSNGVKVTPTAGDVGTFDAQTHGELRSASANAEVVMSVYRSTGQIPPCTVGAVDRRLTMTDGSVVDLFAPPDSDGVYLSATAYRPDGTTVVALLTDQTIRANNFSASTGANSSATLPVTADQLAFLVFTLGVMASAD